MHTLTLSFDSLAEAHAALSKLIGTPLATTVEPVAQATATAEQTEKTKAATTKTKATTPPAEQTEKTKPGPAEATVPYAKLQAQVFELARIVKEKGLNSAENVLAIAVKHGGATFKEVPSANFAAALEDVVAKIAEINAVPAEAKTAGAEFA